MMIIIFIFEELDILKVDMFKELMIYVHHFYCFCIIKNSQIIPKNYM